MTFRDWLPVAATMLAVLPLFGRAAVAEPQPQVTGPILHESVAVYFLRGASAPGPVPLTLQEALDAGTVEVRETGNVQELKIENKGKLPVFVQFGDIVKGGQQDRVLTVSMMLAPNSGLVPIGSYCVEQGRWSARGAEDAKRFTTSNALMPSREAKIAMAKPKAAVPPPSVGLGLGDAARRELRQEARPQGERRTVEPNPSAQRRIIERAPGGDGQSEVWRSVDAMQRQLSAALAAPVASETSRTSLQLALEAEALKAGQAAYVAALEPKGLDGDDIIGVVVAINGRISSADVYPSNGLFRKMWPKLTRAVVTEALAQKRTDTADTRPVAPPVSDVEAFLKMAESGEASVRQLGTHARIETRSSEKALHLEVRTGAGDFVHRNYIAY